MPLDLLVSIPAWGEWYVDLCLSGLIPSLKSQYPISSNIRYIVYTDQPYRIAGLLPFAEFRPVPMQRSDHETMNACHKDSLASARNEAVILLVADQILSIETFVFCANKFMDEKTKAIYCVSPRTLVHPRSISAAVGMNARELLKWGWDRRHPWTEASVLGRGNGRYNSVVYFDTGKSVVAHAFHPHPVAVLKDREIEFEGTLDVGLLKCFSSDEIFLVQECEFSCIEISADNKIIPSLSDSPFTVHDVIRWSGWTPSAQRRMFAQRTIICGSGDDCDDENQVAEIMLGLSDASPI